MEPSAATIEVLRAAKKQQKERYEERKGSKEVKHIFLEFLCLDK